MGRRSQRYGEEEPDVWGGGARGMGRRSQRYGEEEPEVNFVTTVRTQMHSSKGKGCD